MMNKRAPIFAAIGVVVVVLLVFLLLVNPKRSAVNQAQSDYNAAQTKQTQLEAQLDQLQALKQQAQETRRQLQKFATQIPPTADEPGLIRLMQLAADRAGVDLTVNAFGNPTPQGNLNAITVDLTVEGQFLQVYQYLYQLETLPRVLRVSHVTITPGQYPLLTVAVSGSTYTTDASAGPGSEVGPQESVGTTTTSTEASPAATTGGG